MTKFKYLGNIEKLIHQNQGEIIDAAEGCLLDDLMIATKRGYMLALETYLNPNASTYTIIFEPYTGNTGALWDILQDRQADAMTI